MGRFRTSYDVQSPHLMVYAACVSFMCSRRMRCVVALMIESAVSSAEFSSPKIDASVAPVVLFDTADK